MLWDTETHICGRHANMPRCTVHPTLNTEHKCTLEATQCSARRGGWRGERVLGVVLLPRARVAAQAIRNLIRSEALAVERHELALRVQQVLHVGRCLSRPPFAQCRCGVLDRGQRPMRWACTVRQPAQAAAAPGASQDALQPQ
jgi:hypothetical protein